MQQFCLNQLLTLFFFLSCKWYKQWYCKITPRRLHFVFWFRGFTFTGFAAKTRKIAMVMWKSSGSTTIYNKRKVKKERSCWKRVKMGRTCVFVWSYKKKQYESYRYQIPWFVKVSALPTLQTFFVMIMPNQWEKHF